MSKVNQELPDGLARGAPQSIRRVGILGANMTGIGIAMHLLEADIPVTIFDGERTSLDEGLAMLRSACQEAVLHSGLAEARHDRWMAFLSGTVNFHHLKDCDLVIEAVSTEMHVKEKLFRRLDQVVKPGAMLVTCTSTSKVDHLAGFTKRPGQVLGLQLPSAPDGSASWRPIPGKCSSGQSLATVAALVQNFQTVCAGVGQVA